jgi:hypothetical protein
MPNVSDWSWRKSSRSNDGGNGNCVEVAFVGRLTAVRDSKQPTAGVLAFPHQAWSSFLAAANAGRF